MERRKTLTMNWDGLGDVDDDDERFFESFDRLSCAVPLDLASSSDDDDDDAFDDPRMSFMSAISTAHSTKYRAFSKAGGARVSVSSAADPAPDYGIWMAAPAPITERRKRLLHGMGLDDNKEFLNGTSQFESGNKPRVSVSISSEKARLEKQKTEHSPVSFVLSRSRSEGDIDSFSTERSRKLEMIGKASKQRLTRTATEIAAPRARMIPYARFVAKDAGEARRMAQHARKISSAMGAFFLIKNLDTGKEFIVNECGENGTWHRLSDLQSGKQLTMEEFEKAVGQSRVVTELMRRARAGRSESRKLGSSSYISRSLRMSKRRGVALLKNIKGVASGIIGEREREVPAQIHQQVVVEAKPAAAKNQWVRVRQSGKSHKELSALHLCQEFQAHEGCIWTIKFSFDGRYLASAGEDLVIHVWQVQECEVMSLRPEEGTLTPLHPSSSAEKKKKKNKGRFGSKRGNVIPEYVHVPDTVFSFSEKPYCTFQGHSDEVLDLSWSKSQPLMK